jgi:hypothetical protein
MCSPDGGKSIREGNDVLVFRAFPQLAEAGVIAVLLGTLRVPPCGLEVAVGKRTNPDVRPGRRDGQGCYPSQHVTIRELGPVGQDVPESSSVFFRRMPGRASETYLRPADSAASFGSTIACTLSADSTSKRKPLYFPP